MQIFLDMIKMRLTNKVNALIHLLMKRLEKIKLGEKNLCKIMLKINY